VYERLKSCLSPVSGPLFGGPQRGGMELDAAARLAHD